MAFRLKKDKNFGKRTNKSSVPAKNKRKHPAKESNSSFKQVAKSILNNSIEDDIDKLEKITARNLDMRRKWLQVQEEKVFLQFVSTIHQPSFSHPQVSPKDQLQAMMKNN